MHWSVFGNRSCVTLPPAFLQSWESRFKSLGVAGWAGSALLYGLCWSKSGSNEDGEVSETSDHTCIKSRIETLKGNRKSAQFIERFVGSNPEETGLPFVLRDYLELVDWTGRLVRKGKRGNINLSLPPILERLSIDRESWLILTTGFESQFGQWVGSEHIVRQIYSDRHYHRIPSANRLLSLPCNQRSILSIANGEAYARPKFTRTRNYSEL
jgi:hypothetical protein